MRVGEKAKAEKHHHWALTIFEKTGRKLRVGDCFLNLGQVLELLGEVRKSVDYFLKAADV